MEVYHEKFGNGIILKSTEQFDESGDIISADVMFEHGIEHNLQLEEAEDIIDEELKGNQHKIDANKNGKIDAEDFKKLGDKKPKFDKDDEDCDKDKVATHMKESIVKPATVTPDTAATRMPAVESVVRDIMSQHRNLRQEAKIADFKSRNK